MLRQHVDIYNVFTRGYGNQEKRFTASSYSWQTKSFPTSSNEYVQVISNW